MVINFFLISGDGLRGHVTPFFLVKLVKEFVTFILPFLQSRGNSHLILKITIFMAEFTNFMIKFTTLPSYLSFQDSGTQET